MAAKSKFFIKTGSGKDAEIMFAGEHASLNAIHNSVPTLCPKSYGHGRLGESPSKHFLVSDFLDLSSRFSSSSISNGLSLAQKIAKLHTTPASTPEGYDRPQFGFPATTCCGDTPQENSYKSSWADFYAENRLMFILKRSEKSNGADESFRDLVERTAYKVVPRLIGDAHLNNGKGVTPVVIHGDLWSGNASLGKLPGMTEPEDVIFDSSAVYGHSEFELGIMNMFGGFESEFFKEYHGLVPKTEPREEYEDRVELYELYHQLNHYALFGGSHRSGAVKIMESLVEKYVISSHAITTFRYDSDSKSFVKKTVDRQLGLKEILIKITHSGLCYTDVHAKDKGCGLGHEGVGSVEKVGDAVSNMKVGDRVGWGWLRSSCGQCSSCLDGYRQYCASASGFGFCDLEQGAFADYHIIDSAFAYHIPDYMLSSHASVFMCAGASTYEALIAVGTKSSDRVGVVGLGGLGHMAVQFAKAMGCNVTVLSDSAADPSAAGKAESKARDAFDLGADEVRAVKDPSIALTRDREGLVVYLGPGWYDFEASSDHRAINVLLVCANETPDFEKVLPLLARRAVIVLMSIQTQPLNIPYMPFILPGHKLISSTEASTRNHLEMIKFADRHKIKPWIEEFEMTEAGLREAFERLESGKMRYRGVVKVPGTRGNGMADALEAFNRLR